MVQVPQAAVVAVALLFIALAAPAQAAPDAATAAKYDYPLKIEDPAGDQKGLSPAPAPAPNPGDGNPENDILAFEATNDPGTVVFRVTMANMGTFTTPGPVTLSLSLTGPHKEDWEISVSYTDNGASPTVADFDPASGDADVLMPGASAVTDPAAAQVYIFADMNAAGLAPGDVLQLDSLGSGKGVSTPAGSVTFPNRDAVDMAASTYQIHSATATGPVRVFGNLTGATVNLAQSWSESHTAVHSYNWTTALTAATVHSAVTVKGGSVDVAVLDAAGHTVLNQTAATGEQNQTASNLAAGKWTIRVAYTNFTGDVNLQVGPQASASASGSSSSGHASGSASSSSSGAGASGSNSGSGSSSSTAKAKGSPAPGPALLVAALAALALVLRRRLNA